MSDGERGTMSFVAEGLLSMIMDNRAVLAVDCCHTEFAREITRLRAENTRLRAERAKEAG